MEETKIEESKVVISIPSGRGEVPLVVMTAIIDMILYTKRIYPKISIAMLTLNMTYIHKARQTIAESFLETDADRMLCIDDDNVPAKDSLVKLLELDLPIASGLYFRKSAPYEPLIMLGREGGLGSESRAEMIINGDTEPFVVHSTGFGFILIKREVFEKMRTLEVPMFDIRGGVGEDVWFCMQAKSVGYDTIIDPTIEIGHLGAKINVGRKEYIDYYNDNIKSRIEKAKETEGFLEDKEIEYLSRKAMASDSALEIGSWQGRSTQVMALAQKLTCIDRFDGLLDGDDRNIPDIREEFDINTQDFKNITVIEGFSSKEVGRITDMSLDFMFIDGDHHYEQAKEDIENYFPKLKNGGIMAIHDCCQNFPEVVKAIAEFVEANKPILVGRQIPDTTIYEIIKL